MTHTAARPGPFGRLVSAQAAHPRGLLGHLIGRLWIAETAAVNDRAIELLRPQAGEHILEIGFGPGRAAAAIVSHGAQVTGIDVSTRMLAQARRRNRAAVASGQAHLMIGSVEDTGVQHATVDGVLAVHTLYFWPDRGTALSEIHRVLVPGGRIVLAFRGAERAMPRRFDPAVYRVPTTDQVRQELTAAGFGDLTTEHDERGTAHVTART